MDYYSANWVTVAEMVEFSRRSARLLAPSEHEALITALATGLMSQAFKSIRKGLVQAIAYEEGRLPGVRVHRIRALDVKAVREKTGLTQLEFAERFAISPGALRHWERGDRRPHGTALVLLCIIDREPKAVLRALQGVESRRAAD